MYHCAFGQDESPKYKFQAPTKVKMERCVNEDDENSDKKLLGGTILTPEESLVWGKVYSKDKALKDVIKEFRKQMNYSKDMMTTLI